MVPGMGDGRGPRPGKGARQGNKGKGNGKGAGVAGAPRGEGKGEGKGGGGGRGAPPPRQKIRLTSAPPQQPAAQLQENRQKLRLTSRGSRRDGGRDRDRRDYGQGQGAGSESGTRPPRTISEQLEAIGIQTFAFGPPPDLERWTPAQLEALRHEDDDPAPPPPPGPPPPPPRDIDVEPEFEPGPEPESEAEVLLIRGPIGLTDCDGTSLLTDPFPGPIGRMPPPSDLGNSNLPLRAETSKKSSDGHGKTWPGAAGAAMDRPGAARPWTDLALARGGHGQTDLASRHAWTAWTRRLTA